jgi:hypothetical protein
MFLLRQDRVLKALRLSDTSMRRVPAQRRLLPMQKTARDVTKPKKGLTASQVRAKLDRKWVEQGKRPKVKKVKVRT